MYRKRIVQMCMAILSVLVLCLTPSAMCAATTDTSGYITITTRDHDTKAVVGDAVYRLYTFATATISNNKVTYTYTDAFKDNGMTLEKLGDASLPLHLAVYAANHNLPYIEKAADDTGVVRFDDVAMGAYVVVPIGVADGYMPATPLVVCLPKTENGAWQYHEDCIPKIQPKKEKPSRVTLAVQKKWEGTSNIPASISVSLTKDGKPFKTISLNAENDWYYRWTDLDDNHAWSVVEPTVPAGYQVTYDTSERLVIITNTTSSNEEDPPLLQTGQLNWPVPILLMVGLVLILIGWSLLNFSNKDEETT